MLFFFSKEITDLCPYVLLTKLIPKQTPRLNINGRLQASCLSKNILTLFDPFLIFAIIAKEVSVLKKKSNKITWKKCLPDTGSWLIQSSHAHGCGKYYAFEKKMGKINTWWALFSAIKMQKTARTAREYAVPNSQNQISDQKNFLSLPI